MIVIPSIDLRDGACLRHPDGAAEGGPVQLVCAIETARAWTAQGFSRLHVTDLDAAAGRGDNALLVTSLLHAVDASIQVGGDVHTSAEVDRLLESGVDRVVIGPRGIADHRWLSDVALQFPGRVAVAALVRERRVVTRDWGRTMPPEVLSVVDDLNELPLAALIVTIAQRDGRVRGIDLFLVEDLTELSVHPLLVAGGITTLSELRDLEERGVSAAIVGRALHAGRLDARMVADEFSPR